MTRNTQWVLAARPVGAVRPEDFRMIESPLRPLAEGEFRIEVLYLGVAAVMRGYMLNTEKFERPLELGDVMHGRGVGRIVESRNANWRVGEIVHGKMGWQQYAIADGSLQAPMLLRAIRDGGAIATVRGWDGPTERGIVAHPVWVRDYITNTASLDELRQLVEAGHVTPRVAVEIPAARASEAHAALEAGGTRGRLVLVR